MTVLVTVEAHVEDGRFITLFEAEITKGMRSSRQKLGIGDKLLYGTILKKKAVH